MTLTKIVEKVTPYGILTWKRGHSLNKIIDVRSPVIVHRYFDTSHILFAALTKSKDIFLLSQLQVVGYKDGTTGAGLMKTMAGDFS
jgi:hypothetical protein